MISLNDMTNYSASSLKLWTGRVSDNELYLHEKVRCIPLEKLEKQSTRAFGIIGYACDEGVRRNQGRVGAKEGPNAIRSALAKMPNHLKKEIALFDVGTITCNDKDLQTSQNQLSTCIASLLELNLMPIVLGGGHDVAYAHFNGIKDHLISKNKRPSIGIINFDAHFDLRKVDDEPNSGTPFNQISNENEPFEYVCLGIRKDANHLDLFKSAQRLGVKYLERETFRMQFVEEINKWITAFSKGVDHLYVTIDLDGFSSAFAPGVSAPSPMGFSPDIVLESLKTIINTGKLIAVDIAEMNPKYDIDGQTAKLAASLVHYIIHS